jgi:RNA polymerase sigma factor (sigma-70 family)
MDEYRNRYGRVQSNHASAEQLHSVRRNLTDLLGNEFGLEQVESLEIHSPDVELQNAEWRDALGAALARLEVVDRLILRMRFEDDLSVPEIARLLNLGSSFGVYRRLKKVMSQVRSDLEAAGIRDGHA